MKANDKQYGGDHYRQLKIQVWDYVEANKVPYLEACAIKYLTRWRDKGGLEDLRKAIHFIEKRIELELDKTPPLPKSEPERVVISRPGSPPTPFNVGRFEESPCYICGYHGSGYFQPDTHPCAIAYHQARDAIDQGYAE